MSLHQIYDGLPQFNRKAWQKPLGPKWWESHWNCETIESLKRDIMDTISKVQGIALETVLPASEISPFNHLATISSGRKS